MDASTQPVPPARETTSAAVGSRIDEIVIVLFAFLGVGGAVFLPLYFRIPPITTSFLLATGLAALTYRFLGAFRAHRSPSVASSSPALLRLWLALP